MRQSDIMRNEAGKGDKIRDAGLISPKEVQGSCT